MRARFDYDLVIVGLGSGGATAAELATRIGVRTLAVERHRIGGDCLWTGCVPSKAALAAAKAAHIMRTANRFGLPATDVQIDRAAVWRRIRSVQAEIAASDDNAERFEGWGAEVATGDASLVAPQTVAIGERIVRSRFVLLCTGSRPRIPDVPGLADARPLTSDTVWDLDEPPQRLIVIGGGPIAVELAQATSRLGVDVTVLQRGERLLPKEEPVLADALTGLLREEGVTVVLGADVRRVDRNTSGIIVHGLDAGMPTSWWGDDVLVATGRTPTTDGLGLDGIGVVMSADGIAVDDRMRTNLPWLYAAGDVTGRNLFTHAAGYEAVRAVRDMFFPGRGRADALIPWCTFTDPELAHAGMTEREARAVHGSDIRVRTFDLRHSDRARADDVANGCMRVITGPKQKVVGAHILAAGAGEMIHELALAIQRGMRLGELASLVHVYPTLSTSIGQIAAESAYESAQRYSWVTRLARSSTRRR